MASNTINFTINLGGNAYTGIAQIDKALNSVNVNAKKTEKLFEKITNATFKFNNIFQTVQTVIGKVSGSIEKMIDAGSENELQKMNMATLFKGNAAAAEDMFARISKYGKETVYDKAGLIEAQKTMMSFGISGEKSFATLKQIGDIAMGDKQKMQSLALAFSQATSAGKLQGQDLLQLINAGFNPLQVISERTGESMLSLKEKMSKGQISAEMLSQAFRWATDEQGLFYNGAEQAGTTTMGRINQLKDTFDEFLISTFDKLKPLIDTCLEFATGVLGKLPALFERVKSAVAALKVPIIAVASALGAYGATILMINAYHSLMTVWKSALAAYELVVFAVKNSTNLWTAAQWLLNVALAANPIALIIAGVVALIAVIGYVCSKITGWGSLWQGVVGFMKYSFYAFVDAVKLYFDTYINGFLIGLDKIKLGWYKFKESAGIGDSSENQAAIAQINADVEARQKAIVDGAQAVKENALKAKESLAGIEMGWKGKEKTEETKSKIGINEQLQSVVGGTGIETSTGKNSATGASTEGVATGGTRNTQIHINIGDMIKQVTFNGTTAENKQEIERNFAECLYRVLGMAQASIG
ncbi:MAG: tape measure protein [Paludibacteraceae bacterium]